MTARTPLWIRGRSDDSFKADDRRPCIGRHEYFDDTIEALAVCQSLCVTCPVFQDCTRWTLSNYDRDPYFIYAGLTQDVRGRIHAGLESYYDWRKDWRRTHLTERVAARKLRASYLAGERKRAKAKTEMPHCPHCDHQDAVRRNGFQDGHQRYHCRTCNKAFQGGSREE